ASPTRAARSLPEIRCFVGWRVICSNVASTASSTSLSISAERIERVHPPGVGCKHWYTPPLWIIDVPHREQRINPENGYIRTAAPLPGWWKFRAFFLASSTSETRCQVSSSTIAGHAAFICIFEVFARLPSGMTGRYSRTPLLEGL